MQKTPLISPSILSADFAKIGEEIKRISTADLIHCDVMDGRFVPNITFGPKMIEDIKKITNIPLDTHLMIVEPEAYIKRFIKAGTDILTFHIEATKKHLECLKMIKEEGIKGGMAISPDTPVSAIEPYLEQCDIVVLMSVYPGFGGQKFIENSMQRLIELKKIRDKINPNALIEIDGGITLENAFSVVENGVDVLVAGNAVFGASIPMDAIQSLKGK